MTRRCLDVAIEDWPLKQPFVIARGAKHAVRVIVVRLTEGAVVGWGEATPTAHYHQTPEGSAAAIEAVRPQIEREERVSAEELGLTGSAANALDCALVDLAAKKRGARAWHLLGEPAPGLVHTTATVSLGPVARMAADALAWPGFDLIKVKLGGGEEDVERIRAVRGARPDARLICDANEGWSVDQLSNFMGVLVEVGLEMIEQPCPAGKDAELRDFDSPIPLCADESCHVAADVEQLVGRYDMVNVKLDKAGGIRPALELVREAENHAMGIMVGCMLGTSLAMAPGTLVAQHAAYVDLDGPLALARDRSPALQFGDGTVAPPEAALWG